MRYVLNLRPNYNVETLIDVSQYDTELRKIELALYYGKEVYPIPAGSIVTVRGTKADNTVFDIPLTYAENVATWELTDKITTAAGVIPCQLRITNTGALIGTAAFKLIVQESPLDAEHAVVSDSQLPLIESASQHAAEAAQARNEAVEAAEKATEALETISLTVTPTEDGARVTARDLSGETSAEVHNGKDGKDGADGFSPEASVEDHGDGTYTLTVKDKDGTSTVTFRAGTDGDSLEASSAPTEGGTKVTIRNARTHAIEAEFIVKNGEKGDTGDTGPRGPIGEPGATGNGFSCAVLNSDYTLTLTFTDGTSYTTPPIRGARGPQGETGETGQQGPKGDTGNGIQSVTKTATAGLVDTYTITYTDGQTSNFTVTNGENGTDYVLTAADKTEIADAVYALLTNANGQSF
jgi:hypothetical protein